METQNFDSAGELARFVTTEGILQANIVWILVSAGRWYLFYTIP